MCHSSCVCSYMDTLACVVIAPHCYICMHMYSRVYVWASPVEIAPYVQRNIIRKRAPKNWQLWRSRKWIEQCCKAFYVIVKDTACLLSNFKHGSLLSIVNGVPACILSKCTYYSLPQLFVHQITGLELSTSTLALYYLTSTAILLVGSETVERISYF